MTPYRSTTPPDPLKLSAPDRRQRERAAEAKQELSKTLLLSSQRLFQNAVKDLPCELISPATASAFLRAALASAFEIANSSMPEIDLATRLAELALTDLRPLCERANPLPAPDAWRDEMAGIAAELGAKLSPLCALTACGDYPDPIFKRVATALAPDAPTARAVATELSKKGLLRGSARLLLGSETLAHRVNPGSPDCFLSLALNNASALNFKSMARVTSSSCPRADYLADIHGAEIRKFHESSAVGSLVFRAQSRLDLDAIAPSERAPLGELARLALFCFPDASLPAYLAALKERSLSTGEPIDLDPGARDALIHLSDGPDLALRASAALQLCPSSRIETALGLLDRVKDAGPKNAPPIIEAASRSAERVFSQNPQGLLVDIPHKLDHGSQLGANFPEALTRALTLSKIAPGAPGSEAAESAFSLCLLAGYKPGSPPPGRKHSLVSKLSASRSSLGAAWSARWEALEIAASLDAPAPSRLPRKGL